MLSISYLFISTVYLLPIPVSMLFGIPSVLKCFEKNCILHDTIRTTVVSWRRFSNPSPSFLPSWFCFFYPSHHGEESKVHHPWANKNNQCRFLHKTSMTYPSLPTEFIWRFQNNENDSGRFQMKKAMKVHNTWVIKKINNQRLAFHGLAFRMQVLIAAMVMMMMIQG